MKIYSLKEFSLHVLVVIVFVFCTTFLFFLPSEMGQGFFSKLSAYFWSLIGGSGLVFSFLGIGGGFGLGLRLVILLFGENNLDQCLLKRYLANMAVFSIYGFVGVIFLLMYISLRY